MLNGCKSLRSVNVYNSDMLHGLISEARCILTFYNGLVSEARYIPVLKIGLRVPVYRVNSVMLTSSALPQVHVRC